MAGRATKSLAYFLQAHHGVDQGSGSANSSISSVLMWPVSRFRPQAPSTQQRLWRCASWLFLLLFLFFLPLPLTHTRAYVSGALLAFAATTLLALLACLRAAWERTNRTRSSNVKVSPSLSLAQSPPSSATMLVKIALLVCFAALVAAQTAGGSGSVQARLVVTREFLNYQPVQNEISPVTIRIFNTGSGCVFGRRRSRTSSPSPPPQQPLSTLV